MADATQAGEGAVRGVSALGGLIAGWLRDRGLESSVVLVVTTQTILAVLVLLVSIAVNIIARKLLLVFVPRFIRRSRTTWDDIALEEGVFTRLSHLAPALVIYASAPLFPSAEGWLMRAAVGYMALVGLLVAGAVLNTVVRIYRSFEIARNRPIRGYIQAAKVFLYVLGGIGILATLIGQSPWKLLSGIGALTAILLLIFRDSILGFVASIQMSSYDMVRLGDWIEMPKYGADGEVIDVSLNTVKVQNWDKTITTIPTPALVADSFKNWRGMEESGGRRIKRAFYLDMNSIRFCTEEMLDRFEKFAYMKEYIRQKREEIAAWNAEHGFDMSVMVNGRRLTNIGCFRAYIAAYLEHHPKIHKDMTFLIRHLAPTEHGLPIEIYVFTTDTRWAYYEAIQADIFDHILAVVPEFDLSVYQSPSGRDLREGVRALASERESDSV